MDESLENARFKACEDCLVIILDVKVETLPDPAIIASDDVPNADAVPLGLSSADMAALLLPSSS